jgi:hypothetical protein
VFDVLSTKSSVCLNTTVDVDADLMCSVGKKKNESNKRKKYNKEQKKNGEKNKYRLTGVKTYDLLVFHNDD